VPRLLWIFLRAPPAIFLRHTGHTCPGRRKIQLAAASAVDLPAF
jgi:hypothetical protein